MKLAEVDRSQGAAIGSMEASEPLRRLVALVKPAKVAAMANPWREQGQAAFLPSANAGFPLLA